MKNSKWMAIAGVVAVTMSMGQAWGGSISAGPSFCNGSKTTVGDVCKVSTLGSPGAYCILGNYWGQKSGSISIYSNSCGYGKNEVVVYSCDGNTQTAETLYCHQGDDCVSGKCWHYVKTANGGSGSSYVPTLTTDPNAAVGVNGSILSAGHSSSDNGTPSSGASGASSWSSVGNINNSKIPSDSKPNSGASDQAQSGGCSLIR